MAKLPPLDPPDRGAKTKQEKAGKSLEILDSIPDMALLVTQS